MRTALGLLLLAPLFAAGIIITAGVAGLFLGVVLLFGYALSALF